MTVPVPVPCRGTMLKHSVCPSHSCDWLTEWLAVVVPAGHNGRSVQHDDYQEWSTFTAASARLQGTGKYLQEFARNDWAQYDRQL